MAIILVLNTNTWVTLTEANNYFESKWNTDMWATLTDDNKNKLLITAFEWIKGESDYTISTVTTSLKKAQMELAWWIYGNNETWEKHQTLWASGVKEFRISKFWESLNEPSLPLKVKKLLGDYNTKGGGYFPLMDRDVDQNM